MEISYIYFRIQWVIKISKLFKSALLPKYSISPSTTFLKWKHYILLKKCEQWSIDLLNFQTMEFPANLSNKARFLCSIHSFFYFMWMVYAWVAINDQIFQILSLSLLLCLFKDSSDCHHVHCCLVFFCRSDNKHETKILTEHTSPPTYCFISPCFYNSFSWKKIWCLNFFILF